MLKVKNFIIRYVLYLFRWQLSTPILSIVLIYLNNWNITVATVIANLIGGLIFFWIDKFIFKDNYIKPQWEIKEDTTCCDCGKEHITGYRITLWHRYNRINDDNPKYRCRECSINRMNSGKY